MLAEILSAHWPAYVAKFGRLIPAEQHAAVRAILRCRTPALGGQRYRCACGREHFAYHSCNHRACPRCGRDDAAEWLAKQRARLLPVPYFLVTFTLPEQLREPVRAAMKPWYGALLKESAGALQDLASQPKHLGAELGPTALLQTWTRDLRYHPHVHVLVPGGGLTSNRLRWMRVPDPEFFLPQVKLAARFKGRLQAWLKQHAPKLYQQVPAKVWWLMVASGGARAVHHIESPAMTGLCRQCNVHDIDTLIAIVSVIRPGAANEGKKTAFTRRYQGLEPVTYPHPSLEPVLRDTFGLVVYEEHILQICEAYAGLPPGRADVLRRALNKNKRETVAEIRTEFFACADARGHPREKTEEVWQLVTGFAGYAFCKAHSTAYGVEAYQAAWLKCYHPAEFMAAVLSNGKGFYHPLVYVLESHRLGLKFLPPTVNEPGPKFAVSGNAICVPLTHAKGLSDKTAKRIIAERQRASFATLADFHRRVNPSHEEMETIIRAGGFDEFGESRTRQFWEAQYLQQTFGASSASGQGWLLAPPSLDRFPQVSLKEPTRRERLEAETELFGYAVSAHPLELFSDVAWDTYCPVEELGLHTGEIVVTCGLVVEHRTHHQITGEPMKFLTLADWTGMVETELFAATYKTYGLATVRYPVLEVTATVEPFENGRGFSLRVLRASKPRLENVPPQ